MLDYYHWQIGLIITACLIALFHSVQVD